MKNHSLVKKLITTILFFLLIQTNAVYATDSGETAAMTDAINLYRKATVLETDSAKRKEYLKQAEAILSGIIKNNPKSLEAHRKLMGVYLLQQDYTRGISTIKDAINLSPEDPKLFISLAFLYEHSGQLDYSVAMLNQALALDPDSSIAKEYQLRIQKKINKLKMDTLHQGKNVLGEANGNNNPHHSIKK